MTGSVAGTRPISLNSSGRGHVFSNVIIGLGETDAEMEACIRQAHLPRGDTGAASPLNPVAEFTGKPRPSAERLTKLFRSAHARPLSVKDWMQSRRSYYVHELRRLRPRAREG